MLERKVSSGPPHESRNTAGIRHALVAPERTCSCVSWRRHLDFAFGPGTLRHLGYVHGYGATKIITILMAYLYAVCDYKVVGTLVWALIETLNACCGTDPCTPVPKYCVIKIYWLSAMISNVHRLVFVVSPLLIETWWFKCLLERTFSSFLNLLLSTFSSLHPTVRAKDIGVLFTLQSPQHPMCFPRWHSHSQPVWPSLSYSLKEESLTDSVLAHFLVFWSYIP